jgi:hypothetical protein
MKIFVFDTRPRSESFEFGEQREKDYRVDTKLISIRIETDMGFRVIVDFTHDEIREVAQVSQKYLENLAKKRAERAIKKGSKKEETNS